MSSFLLSHDWRNDNDSDLLPETHHKGALIPHWAPFQRVSRNSNTCTSTLQWPLEAPQKSQTSTALLDHFQDWGWTREKQQVSATKTATSFKTHKPGNLPTHPLPWEVKPPYAYATRTHWRLCDLRSRCLSSDCPVTYLPLDFRQHMIPNETSHTNTIHPTSEPAWRHSHSTSRKKKGLTESPHTLQRVQSHLHGHHVDKKNTRFYNRHRL